MGYPLIGKYGLPYREISPKRQQKGKKNIVVQKGT